MPSRQEEESPDNDVNMWQETDDDDKDEDYAPTESSGPTRSNTVLTQPNDGTQVNSETCLSGGPANTAAKGDGKSPGKTWKWSRFIRTASIGRTKVVNTIKAVLTTRDNASTESSITVDDCSSDSESDGAATKESDVGKAIANLKRKAVKQKNKGSAAALPGSKNKPKAVNTESNLLECSGAATAKAVSQGGRGHAKTPYSKRHSKSRKELAKSQPTKKQSKPKGELKKPPCPRKHNKTAGESTSPLSVGGKAHRENILTPRKGSNSKAKKPRLSGSPKVASKQLLPELELVAVPSHKPKYANGHASAPILLDDDKSDTEKPPPAESSPTSTALPPPQFNAFFYRKRNVRHEPVRYEYVFVEYKKGRLDTFAVDLLATGQAYSEEDHQFQVNHSFLAFSNIADGKSTFDPATPYFRKRDNCIVVPIRKKNMSFRQVSVFPFPSCVAYKVALEHPQEVAYCQHGSFVSKGDGKDVYHCQQKLYGRPLSIKVVSDTHDMS